jgi:hypothetical protein
MNPRIWLYLFFVVTGLVVLCWPEEDNLMLLQFSEAHGPSRLDSIGIAIIMIGYVPMVAQVIKRFQFIQTSFGKAKSLSLIAISIFFSGMIALALNFENEPLLWTSVGISSLAQAVLVYWGFKHHPAI